MKISNYNNYNQNLNYKNKTNLKMLDNYYSGKNGKGISLENKKKTIKPPFKQGLYSYKQSFNTLQNDYNKKLLNNKLFIDDSPIYSNNKDKKENNILNLNNIIPQNNISKNSSSLCFSSINLNKYKINTNPNQANKKIIFNNNINNNIGNNLNNIKNTNLSLNININNLNADNNNISKKIYQNYFGDNPKYEKESRRMIIEYIKVLNNFSNNKELKQLFTENNISLKVLNQKYNETDVNYNNNHELFGEAKKQLYLKNLNYSLSYDSFRSNNNEENSNIQNNNNNNSINFLNMNNINNLLFNNEKKKINILNFLCVPRILNLIEDDIPKKYIFLITLDEIYYTEGKESYLFQWKDMNNEVENEFNLKEIKTCEVSKKYNNRFIISIEKEDIIEILKFEIETPSKEICDNYVLGINHLI